MTGKFLLARTLTGIFVVFAVATITFFMLRTLPGGPFDTEKKLPPRIKENIEAKYRLDKPLSVQYLEYMKDL
ncbi:MAG: ABC transporter permease, partial [Candidatus Dadabacteria bacterium]